MRFHRLAVFGGSVGGYAFAALIFYSFNAIGGWDFPGADAHLWDRVGDEVRAGGSPYHAVTGAGGFYYSPPWAVGLAVLSLLPLPAVVVAIFVVEVLSLRYVAGSWLRVGYCCWLPLVPLELFGSQWNLVMTAGIAAAVRGDPRLAVVVAAAKLSPILAIRENWRQAILVAFALVVVSVPVLDLWPAWIAQLVRAFGMSVSPGSQIMIPWLPRLAVAAALAATGRPGARVVAVVIAIPALFPVTLLGLLAALPVPRRAPATHEPARQP